MNKLLACTAFAAVGLFSQPVFADDKPAPKCRMGNGKSATYMDGVARCTLQRAGSQEQTAAATTTAAPTPASEPVAEVKPAPAPDPKPVKKPRRQARRTGSR